MKYKYNIKKTYIFFIVITMLLSSLFFVIPSSRANEVSMDLDPQVEREANEIMKVHLEEVKKAQEGKKIFETILKDNGIKVRCGSEEYWEKLIEYADPAGELRKKDPEKWEKIYEYAYEYSLEYGKKTNENQDAKEGSISTKSTTPFPGGGGSKYNRDGAVKYAYTYVYNYNKAYHKFSSDCTNFVSQCIYEGGGIPMVDEWYNAYWDADDWYYHRNGSDAYDSKNDDSWSWSWVKVESLYEHLTSRGIGQVVSSVNNLERGDIIQMDFYSDGIYDHSMIVTKVERTARGTEIYLTYHTKDTKDKKFSELKTEYPKAKFRYIHIIY